MVGWGQRRTRCRLDRCVLRRSLHYQLVRCSWIRRGRILGFYSEAFDNCCLPLHGHHLRLWWWSIKRTVSIGAIETLEIRANKA